MSEFSFDRISQPGYFSENRLPAHSDHICYASPEEATCGESSLRKNLNGLWFFHYAQNPAQTIPGFQSLDYDCRSWKQIKVPGHIQMQGYDVPQYANTQYPWDGREEIDPGQVPANFNPVASYATYFTIPDSWQGQTVGVCFEGAESSLALWCNGRYVGYTSDSFTPHSFDLTPFLQIGENKLAAQVIKWTSGSWCEDQDFYRFSGLFRDVYLFTHGALHLEDVKVVPTLNPELTQGTLGITLTGSGEGQVLLRLLFGSVEVWAGKQAYHFGASAQMQVNTPALWSAEEPNLYTLCISLQDQEGILREYTQIAVGFRRFEMKNGLMMLNGKRIVFKGVNRHEFCAQSGRVVTKEQTLQDILTMKRNNINAIRTSHYPNRSFLYELCDRYGLYMIDETNLETHGLWDALARNLPNAWENLVPGDNPDWLPMVLDRANSMFQRDKNHPAVLIWSCGNESFGGKNFFTMSEFFRQQDSTRLVHYEGLRADRRYPGTSDMESQMYTSVADIRKFLKENPEKPFICCEYAHAMGNSCGALHKYTELTDQEPRYQGGFIWDYIDQSLTKTDRYGKSYQAYGGDFGERPHDGNFSGNGIVYGENRDPSPKMQEVKYCYQNIEAIVGRDKVLVRNKNLFISTSAFHCLVTVQRDGRECYRYALSTDVSPLSKKTYDLRPAQDALPGEYTITVSFHLREGTLWADAGHEVAFGQYVYQVEAAERPVPTGKMEVIHGRHNIGIRGDGWDALFSCLQRGLVSYRMGGHELLKAVPQANFWRAPTDNDRGNFLPARRGQWKLASQYSNMNRVTDVPFILPTLEEKEDCVTITYHFETPTVPACPYSMVYKVTPDGTIRVTLDCTPPAELFDPPEFGVMLKMDADFGNVAWYGYGPEETYVDRCHGAKLGIYKTTPEGAMAKYLHPQECGNHTGVRWATVTDGKGMGLCFRGESIHFSALPYTPFELENAAHTVELPPVHDTVIRVSLAQMGVGGDDSWGAKTHPEYLLPAGEPLHFSFTMKGVCL